MECKHEWIIRDRIETPERTIVEKEYCTKCSEKREVENPYYKKKV